MNSVTLMVTTLATLVWGNVLPNASFELGLGQGAPTHWCDPFNQFTIRLAAMGEYPAALRIEESADALEGRMVGVIAVKGGQAGRLLSGMVPVRPGQAYALSAYARSDLPSATLRLRMWHKPVDWTRVANAQSHAMVLTKQWRRYELRFAVASYFERGVVEFVAEADQDGEVQIDAVQLEAGPRATPFKARHPVEASMSGKENPLNGILHLADSPLTIDAALYNSADRPRGERLELRLEDIDGRAVFTTTIDGEIPPGFSERKITAGFERVGVFRARMHSDDGTEIGVGPYLFIVHPVMGEDIQAVLYSRDGEIGELPAERVWLPWENKKNWYADPPPLLTVTKDKKIYVQLNDGKVGITTDGGRTWKVPDTESEGWAVGVLKDGTLLRVLPGKVKGSLDLQGSNDEGKTWEPLGVLDGLGGAPQAGPITELADESLIWPIGHPKPGVVHITYAFRSSDGGKTWSEGHPVCPTGEPAITELQSGRLLAVVRNNLPPRPDEWAVFLKDPAWRLWNQAYGRLHFALESVEKNVLLADSDDGGVTWGNVRPGTRLLGEMHGGAVQLPDGRVVLIYVHRVPWIRGGERAKVSRDGGHTWEKELYYLNTTPAVPGYSANCVLPPELGDGKPGMILSLVGERRFGGQPARMQAVRWRPMP